MTLQPSEAAGLKQIIVLINDYIGKLPWTHMEHGISISHSERFVLRQNDLNSTTDSYLFNQFNYSKISE